MKKFYITKFVLITFFFSCEDNEITGSENVSEIENVTFSQVVTTISNNALVASGVIINNNQSLSISPPWYIECQYYYSNSMGNTFLIGGENITINNALPPGISLEWTLEHTVENAENYMNFTIDQLRAYKN